jgi:hypothetical protein
MWKHLSDLQSDNIRLSNVAFACAAGLTFVIMAMLLTQIAGKASVGLKCIWDACCASGIAGGRPM